jgi:hypothetical protein
MDPGAAGLEQVGGPVPAVGGLEHDLGVGAGLGELERQRDWVVVDADGLQHLARRGHADDHRAAAVQVDPDILFTHGASFVVAGVNGPSVQHPGAVTGSGGPAPSWHQTVKSGSEDLSLGLKAALRRSPAALRRGDRVMCRQCVVEWSDVNLGQ